MSSHTKPFRLPSHTKPGGQPHCCLWPIDVFPCDSFPAMPTAFSQCCPTEVKLQLSLLACSQLNSSVCFQCVGKTTLVTNVFESLKNCNPNLKIQGFYTPYARNYNYITWDDMKVVGSDVHDQHSRSAEMRLDLRDADDETKIIVVDKNGKWDSVTVQGAVDMVPPNINAAHRIKIYILPGIYRLYTSITHGKAIDCGE